MVPTAEGSPPRPTHQDILQDQQTQFDNTQDVLPLCRQMIEIVRTGIEAGFFSKGSGGRCIVDDMIMVARGELVCHKHCSRMGGRVDDTGRGGSRCRGGDRGREEDAYIVWHTQ